VTAVLDDLKYLDLNDLSMENIKNIKKTSFKKVIKKKINQKTFENHSDIIMQKYLQPNKTKMNKENAQLIFKLRCRMTEAKVNIKGKYDNLECGACGIEEENQEHIIKCKELNKNNDILEFEYSKLFNGTVLEKLNISKMFKENFKVLEKMRKG
jgi:tRNA 2-selenouridine synthase SelU